MSETKILISGLSSLDQEELWEAVGEAAEFTEPTVPDGTLAEPATILAVVTLGSLSIAAFALWLSKGRRSYLHKRTLRIVHPDGRIEERTLELSGSSEEEVQVEIARQVGEWLGVALPAHGSAPESKE